MRYGVVEARAACVEAGLKLYLQKGKAKCEMDVIW